MAEFSYEDKGYTAPKKEHSAFVQDLIDEADALKAGYHDEHTHTRAIESDWTQKVDAEEQRAAARNTIGPDTLIGD